MSSTIYSDGRYLQKNPGWHAEDSPWKAGHILRILKSNDIRPKTVAEVGCGAGEILRELALNLPEDIQFHGYDISEQAYEIARARETSNLTFHHGDLTEQHAHFDVLLVIDVIEHVEDYLGFLRCIRPRAEQFIFHIPLELSAQWAVRGAPFLEVRERLGHLHYFTEDTALATLRDTGYAIRDYFFTAGALDTESYRGWRPRLARLPRMMMSALNPSLAARVLGGFSLLVLATPDADDAGRAFSGAGAS